MYIIHNLTEKYEDELDPCSVTPATPLPRPAIQPAPGQSSSVLLPGLASS